MNLNLFKFLPFFAAGAIANAAAEAPSIGDIVKYGQHSYIVVFDFNSLRQFEEFQRNVQIMKAADAQIKKLQEEIKNAADAQLKSSLELKLKQLDGEFKANDKIMVDGYNFSSSRQYMVRFLKTNICEELSADEYSTFTFRDGKKINPLEIVTKGDKHYYRKSSVLGIKENDELQRAFQYALKIRSDMAALREKLASTSDVEECAKISEQISALEKALKQNEENMKAKYDIKDGDVIEVEKSKLMLLLTPEENAKIEAEKAIKQKEKN